VTARRCTSCSGQSLEPDFLEDSSRNSTGYIRWIQGPLQKGLFGGARRWGRPRWDVEALRCATCGHVELYST
jgi:hypothetical protein